LSSTKMIFFCEPLARMRKALAPRPNRINAPGGGNQVPTPQACCAHAALSAHVGRGVLEGWRALGPSEFRVRGLVAERNPGTLFAKNWGEGVRATLGVPRSPGRPERDAR
jgi:hypothetical protein